MDNEHILRWLTEFGMERIVRPSDLGKTTWGHEFSWSKASDSGYLIRYKQAYSVHYSLTQKAINKLNEGV
jgi:hypothetical protein